MLHRIRQPKVVVAALVVYTLVAVPGFALAHHRFSDVSSSYPFHDDIQAIASAGITTGYSDGTFRPGDTVNRGPMAAFLNRAAGSGASVGLAEMIIADDSPPNDPEDTEGRTWGYLPEIGSAEFVVPGVDGQQFVTIAANLTLKPHQHCPCNVTVYVAHGESAYATATETIVNPFHSMALTTTIPAPSGANRFHVLARVHDDDISVSEAVATHGGVLLTATTSPMWAGTGPFS